MLQTIRICNLALVEELELDFCEGFNAVTGETGAGKSLVLGALQILLGERTPKSVIRRGAERCEIEARIRLPARFCGLRESVAAVLEESGTPACEDHVLVLRRCLLPSGNRVYVNASASTVRVLARLGELLIEIHGPTNNHSLLRPSHQLDLLDRFAGLDDLRRDCATAYARTQECEARLDAARAETFSESELDFARFQYREIEAAELRPGEEQELSQRHDLLSNARGITAAAGQCAELLADSDDSLVEQLSAAVRQAMEIESVDPRRGEPFRSRLEAVVGELQDLSLEFSDYAGSLEFDGAEMSRIETRLDQIHQVTRKYGGSVEAALALAEELQARLSDFEHHEERIAELASHVETERQNHRELCSRLRQARRRTGTDLAAQVGGALERLGFLRSLFRVDIADADPGPRGSDRVEFCFSPNPGEPPQPLRAIASSGEIARTMLAIKTVLSAADDVPILVFDEVDANIGGRVAVAVARELAAVGRRHQTLCITHLPQIAAVARRHFQVTKQVQHGRTRTHVSVLDRSRRETELARMLGGAEDSQVARNHARELLSEAEKTLALEEAL